MKNRASTFGCLFCKNHGLQPGNLEALAAAHVLATHNVIFAHHVRACLSETGAVAFVGAAGKLALFCAHQPGDFVIGGLMAVRAVQIGRLLFWALIEKFAFIHWLILGSSAPVALAGFLTGR